MCTDGASAMIGWKTGLRGLIKSVSPHIAFTHCMLHKYALVSKMLPLSFVDVLKIVVETVNFVRGRALNYRIFMQLCKEMDSKFKVLLYHTEVRRLPRGKCRRLKGIHSRSDTNRAGAEGLSFYYPRLLHCLDQMLAVMPLSQHRVSSSKTIRPRAPCGARCIGPDVSTWSAVCSETPHRKSNESRFNHLHSKHFEDSSFILTLAFFADIFGALNQLSFQMQEGDKNVIKA